MRPVSHPGIVLKRELLSRGMTQSDLALRCGISDKHISKIISGDPITQSIALKIELVLGIEQDFWIRLQTKYNSYKEECRLLENLEKEEEKSILKLFLRKQYITFIDGLDKKLDLIENYKKILSFFKVAELVLLKTNTNALFKKVENEDTSLEEVLYFGLGTNYAEENYHLLKNDFNKKNIPNLINEIKNIWMSDVSDIGKKLKELCFEYGIILSYVPNIPRSGINGSVTYYNKHPLIQLTDRNKKIDWIIFSLFHELGHLYLHNVKEGVIERGTNRDNQIEIEADNFAQENIIDEKTYNQLIKLNFNKEILDKFSTEKNIPLYLIGGRLFHDKLIEPALYHKLILGVLVK